jgi:hypothetical protein
MGLCEGTIMESAATDPESESGTASRRPDRISVVLVLLTGAMVVGTAWLRFGPAQEVEPPTVGSALPPVRLLDLQTSEARILFGVNGKVVWVVFWSANSPSGQSVLPRLETAWKRLSLHRCFTMVAAATNAYEPQSVRAALALAGATLPVYLATPETLRNFGVKQADPPLHFLIDGDGRIAAMAQGADQETIDRLSVQARKRLEYLDPAGGTRFAAIPPRNVVTARGLR